MDETTSPTAVHSSSTEGTPVKRVLGLADSTPTMSPVVRRLTEAPVIPEVTVKTISKKKRKASVLY